MTQEKLQLYLTRFFLFLLLVSVIGNILAKNWLNLFTSVLAIILIYLPAYLTDNGYLKIPNALQFLIVVFIFAAMYLGEQQNFYYRFWWWDSMLHMIYGMGMGFIGFVMVYILNNNEKIDMMLSPVFIAIFAFCFAVTIGVFWEIFEFWMDTIFSLNMQKSGIIDTMFDLMEDCIGAFVTSTIGYFYIKNRKPSRFQRYLSEVLERNSNFFK
ncbi:hypothetical protein [Halanaerobium praevalens]|uniref:Membrane-spanning protein n=1 Tax=Halanaerobium praevalens (strain ATCC 33744 / DSM 2228 / GSL) TaxID=572479 RepID=E3DP79_HALPG|nr:hypothetical protein [Halanaerobium praevalens]ADO76630.1 hypothetical protein Hprae_0476 [Halanaerobium praevalens DSM 2228]